MFVQEAKAARCVEKARMYQGLENTRDAIREWKKALMIYNGMIDSIKRQRKSPTSGAHGVNLQAIEKNARICRANIARIKNGR